MRRSFFFLAVLGLLVVNAVLLGRPAELEARRGTWTCAHSGPVYSCHDYLVNNCYTDPDCDSF